MDKAEILLKKTEVKSYKEQYDSIVVQKKLKLLLLKKISYLEKERE